MKGKNPQRSTDGIKPTKKRDYDEYLSLFNFKMTPVSPHMLEMVASDYLEWGRNTDALILDEFPDSRGFPQKTWEEWIQRNSYLNLAHQQVKRAIGRRRERLAFLNKANSSIFLISAPKYDYKAPEMNWKELLEQKAALNEASSSKSTIYLVEDEARRKTPEQVAGEAHAKTKKYVKPKYAPRVEQEDEDKLKD